MNFKKIATLSLCVCMSLSLASCGSKSDNKKDTKKKATKGEIVLADYNSVKAYSKEAEVTDDTVQTTIDKLLDNYSTTKDITEGKVKRGDKISIDYIGKIDGVAFDGGTAQDQEITLGYSGYIDGFDDGLEGKKIGETVDLNLQFPDDYQKEELKGKKCVFTVTIKKKIDKEVPKLDDKFVQDNFKKYYDVSTVKELKEFMKNKLRTTQISNAIWKDYVDKCEAKSYDSKEMDKTVKEMQTYYESVYQSQYQVDLDTYLKAMNLEKKAWINNLKDEAKKELKENMIVEEIAKKEKLMNDDIYKKVGLMYCQSYQVESVEDLISKFGKEKVDYVIKYTVVTEWLANKVEIVKGERPTEAPSETGSNKSTEATTEAKKSKKSKKKDATEEATEAITEKKSEKETESETEKSAEKDSESETESK
ncbi:FKBP-type peptidyl-prolyl cis-trans isomerase [Eubacterium sp.]|uniref:FKBP-type peptidyl-prolyl cis-trans isomerase n=1 Tax=Eubacterium sp. TaxID=142586 RepID=UPI0025F2411E|nr:FKBP-type peptidyl-prolyl cis-trans isomerase [Eubacterium sp.]MCR5629196.1 FKBP-type peptidyl-prolyl cis-trans isomerase [Eubacterium sp.]